MKTLNIATSVLVCDADCGRNESRLACNMFAKRIIPLRVPTETVISRIVITATKAIPTSIKMMIDTRKTLEHVLHAEDPRIMLSPSLQLPQRIPDLLFLH